MSRPASQLAPKYSKLIQFNIEDWELINKAVLLSNLSASAFVRKAAVALAEDVLNETEEGQ